MLTEVVPDVDLPTIGVDDTSHEMKNTRKKYKNAVQKSVNLADLEKC